MTKKILFLTSLLLTSAAMHSMEPHKSIEIGHTLCLKPKNYSPAAQCFYQQEDINRLHPDFDTSRPFIHRELLWADTMQKENGIPKDVTNSILLIAFDLQKKDRTNDFISFCNDHAGFDPQRSIVLDGVNTKCTQHLETTLLNLSPTAKQALNLGDHYYIKTNELSFLKGCLGLSPFARERREAHLATALGCCAAGSLSVLSLCAYQKINTDSIMGELLNNIGLNCVVDALLAGCCGASAGISQGSLRMAVKEGAMGVVIGGSLFGMMAGIATSIVLFLKNGELKPSTDHTCIKIEKGGTALFFACGSILAGIVSSNFIKRHLNTIALDKKMVQLGFEKREITKK